MLTLLHNINIPDREECEEHEIVSSCHYWNTDNSLVTVHSPMIDESQSKGEQTITLCFQWRLAFFRTFRTKVI